MQSLASSVFRSTCGVTGSSSSLMRKSSYRMEQISQRIDSFLQSIFSENEDLQVRFEPNRTMR